MTKEIKIGILAAAPGEKVQGYLPVAGTEVEMPVTIINGAGDGKLALVTGGTHGGEYPGIETSIRLARDTAPGDITGGLIIVHPVNVPAFYAKLQYTGPYDGKNLNREYPGLATGTVTQRIAHTISSQLFSRADLYLDLHGGDLHEGLEPFVIYSNLGPDAQNAQSLAYAKAMGIKYVCGSLSDNGAFGCAAKMGVPGFLAEIGGAGLWSEAEVERYLAGVRNVLRLAGVLSGAAEERGGHVLSPGMAGVDATKTGCWYPCVELGQTVKRGQKVGEIRDFFGNLLEENFAPANGDVLFVVTSLAVCGGDPLVALAKE